MATLRFPALMKYYVENRKEIQVSGATVSELLKNLCAQYPAIQPHLFDGQGNLRRHYNLFVNGTHIRELNGMETPVRESDTVILMASAAGG